MGNLATLRATPSDGVLNVVVESPAGSTTKIKWEAKAEVFAMSRPLPLGLSYPHDWGFVPGTEGPDGDPIDALVLSEGTTFPGLVLAVRPIGVVRLEQNRKRGGGRERNDRIIAVLANGPRGEPVRSIDDLAPRVRQELERFFLDVVFFEDKDAKLLGWAGAAEAWELVNHNLAGGTSATPKSATK
jgi:inorganic pyrophosphatase